MTDRVLSSLRPVALAGALLLAACDSPSTSSDDRITELEILGVALQLEPDFSVALTARARRADGTTLSQHGATWTSSDTGVASVTLNGLATGVGLGQAFIVLARDGLRDSIPVEVVATLPRDVRIQDAHMTQATQASSAINYVPMISDRAAVVNANVWCTPACRQPVDVALRIYGTDGVTLRHADTLTVATRFDAPSLVRPSVQFFVPADVFTENIFWQVEADPDKSVLGNAAANDLFPLAEPQRQFVVGVPPLKIKFIPLHLSGYADGLAAVSEADVERYLRMVRSTFPLNTIFASVGPTVASSRLYTSGSGVQYMGALLADLDSARLADESDLETYWMGILRRPAALSNVIVGGIATRPSAGNITGAGARSAIAPMAGTEAIDPLGAITVAHELGHNFGRPHSPCGAPDGLPTFPYAFGFIGAVGHDVQAWAEGRATSALGLSPSATADLMGYCSPSWISDFTFRSILVFRGVLPLQPR
jgi:hypothetical protein